MGTCNELPNIMFPLPTKGTAKDCCPIRLGGLANWRPPINRRRRHMWDWIWAGQRAP